MSKFLSRKWLLSLLGFSIYVASLVLPDFNLTGEQSKTLVQLSLGYPAIEGLLDMVANIRDAKYN